MQGSPASPTISFLIPAKDEETTIARCIESIHRAVGESRLSCEILVCDHDSSDTTALIAENCGALVFTKTDGTIAAVRNFLAAQATSEIFVFIDADVTLAPNWALVFESQLLRHVSEELVVAGSFCLHPDGKSTPYGIWYTNQGHRNANYIGSAHLIVSARTFNQAGGFNQTLQTGEDSQFCLDAAASGSDINLVQDLLVYHHDYPASWRDFVAREAWHGIGDVQSLTAFLQSKVAIVSAVFFALHISIAVGYYAVGLSGILLLTISYSLYRLRDETLSSIFGSFYLSYGYFFGRSLSPFALLRKKILSTPTTFVVERD